MQDQAQKAKPKTQDDPQQAGAENDPRQAALAKRQQERKDGDAAAPGAAAASQLIGRNCKDPAQYVKLIQKYPDEKDAILQALSQKLPDVSKQVAAQLDGGGGDNADGGGDKAKGDDKPLLHKEIAAGKNGEVDLQAGFDGQNASGSVDYKNGDNSVGVGGQVNPLDTSKFGADVHGQVGLGKDATLGAKAGVSGDSGKLSATGEIDYKDPKNEASISGSYADKDNNEIDITGLHHVNDNLDLSTSFGHKVEDGAATNSATAGIDYKSDKVAASGELDVSQKPDGLDLGIKGEGTAMLRDGKVYGTALGGVDVGPDGPHYHFGGGLTITPTERTALTAAGVMDNNGGIDLRLQYDVFKDKVGGAGDLADAKKNALVSLFVGFKKGDGMMGDGSPLNDPMGGGGTISGQNDTGVYAGATIRF